MVDPMVIRWQGQHFMVNQELVLLTIQYVISNHSPIMPWLNITTVNNHLATENANNTLIHLPKQFIWENDSSQNLKQHGKQETYRE